MPQLDFYYYINFVTCWFFFYNFVCIFVSVFLVPRLAGLYKSYFYFSNKFGKDLRGVYCEPLVFKLINK